MCLKFSDARPINFQPGRNANARSPDYYCYLCTQILLKTGDFEYRQTFYSYNFADTRYFTRKNKNYLHFQKRPEYDVINRKLSKRVDLDEHQF